MYTHKWSVQNCSSASSQLSILHLHIKALQHQQIHMLVLKGITSGRAGWMNMSVPILCRHEEFES